MLQGVAYPLLPVSVGSASLALNPGCGAILEEELDTVAITDAYDEDATGNGSRPYRQWC